MVGGSVYMIVFRIVHIVAGVGWGGSVFLFVVFVQPSAAAIGPAAAPFMGELLGKRRVVDTMLRLAGATVAGGLFLYWHDWHLYGTLGDFIGSAFGTALTVGAIAAIAAFAIGLFGTKPGVTRFLALARQASEAGGQPAPEVVAEMGRLQARLRALARTSFAFIVVAVFAMATARAW